MAGKPSFDIHKVKHQTMSPGERLFRKGTSGAKFFSPVDACENQVKISRQAGWPRLAGKLAASMSVGTQRSAVPGSEVFR